MSEKVKDDISRRKALSLLGGALGLALVVDEFESEEAKAQAATETPAAGTETPETGGTAGMKRRKARRTGRHERRHQRRTGEPAAAPAAPAPNPQ